MTDQHYNTITNLEYENASDNDLPSILDDEFRNYTQILIAQEIGVVPKNYLTEHQQLGAFAYYPPMDPRQVRTLAINNITSTEVTRKLADKIYKQLELTFETKIINWNSIVQTTAKRYVTNAVEQAMNLMREKLLERVSDENQTTNIIIQRLILVNTQLKLV